ncbi:MAG TPA: PDR/VanB family oxidoreductase [Rhodoglobus sp.]|nr:PDR/VanB family oxidoreductase [Rhodoglobus sp.]
MSALEHTAFDLVVTARDDSTEGVALLTLARADGSPLPRWQPGAHVDVLLPDGDARQYSLCGVPGDDAYRIGVLREADGRGGSAWIADTAEPGTVLRVAGPRNHFEFVPEKGTRYRFVAGGIGITALAAMLRSARTAGVDYTLEYAGRSRSCMALLPELVAEHGDRVNVYAADEGARLDLDAMFAGLPPFTTTYCCGPARLIDAVEAAGAGRTVKVERFEAKELGAPVRSEPFEVELAFSGLELEVPPDRSVLDVIEEAGVLILSSCRIGTCGTCETRVMDGEVDHRDSILTAGEQAANDVMYPCVSRAVSDRLTLEL